MAEQYVPNLGHEPTEDARRDAVHIALAPVTACEILMPGEHVQLYENNYAGKGDNPIDVVDPFRKKAVMAGERFWLFLYPGTITGLRHLWSHPAFEVKFPGYKDTEKKR